MQAQYLPHNEELSALIKQSHYHMEVEGHSKSIIQDCRCDWEGRKTYRFSINAKKYLRLDKILSDKGTKSVCGYHVYVQIPVITRIAQLLYR